jgi:hypothetical protein
MNRMNCTMAAERLVESARLLDDPDETLRAHLVSCSSCRQQWEEQRELTDGILMLRLSAAPRRSSQARRDMLMHRFAATRPRVRPIAAWMLTAAAVLLVGALLGRNWADAPGPGIRGPEIRSGRPLYSGEFASLSADPAEDGFIAVPYTPPLAPGEMVSVVHAELYPAALARLGLSVDPAWTAELPADLLVGQDGFPRAVRVSDDAATARDLRDLQEVKDF